MKILVVTQYFWPENFRINDLCLELKKRGHEITVLTGVPNYPEGNLYPEYEENSEKFKGLNGIEILRVPMMVRGKTKLQLLFNYLSFMVSCTIIGSWKVRGRSYDVIFVCQLSPATVAIPGLIISKIKGVPTVMWILDLWPDTLKAVGMVTNDFLLKVLQVTMNLIYTRFGLIIVQSKSFKKKIKSLIADKTDVHYIPTWAEDNFSSVCEKSHSNGFKDRVFTVAFAGNIGNAQDVYCIVKAANELKQYSHIHFNIIGDGREAAGVSRSISQYGLRKTVKMLGRHPLEKMPKFYQEADAMIISLQHKELYAMTIPGKLQSYLAAGKAIVGAIDGEAQMIIKEAKAGYCVASGDYIGLAEVILKMSKLTPHQMSIFEKNARNYYVEEFSRSKIIDRFEILLRELL
jgi:glycosyltransferase involved in cell wall biosynthesis